MSGPYRAVMICDFNNPVSMKYAEVARHSFSKCKKIEIELWQCFTPDTLVNLSETKMKLTWNEFDTRTKYKNVKRPIPDKEKACFASHAYWWHEIARTNERIIVLEHDAWLRNQSKFEAFLDQIPNHTLWNPGIAAECYTMSPALAKFLRKTYMDGTVVGGGPMAELFYLNQRFYSLLMKMGQDIHYTLWPTTFSKPLQVRSERNPTLCICKHDKRNLQSAAVTQMYNYDSGNTIEHNLPINRRNNPDVEFIDNELFDQLYESAKLEQNS